MKSNETYLQKAWSDPIEGVTMEDIRQAITELQTMDDEHAAFWVGIFLAGETVLEVSRDLTLIAVFDGDEFNALEKRARNREEVEKLYRLFLTGDMETLRSWFEQVK